MESQKQKLQKYEKHNKHRNAATPKHRTTETQEPRNDIKQRNATTPQRRNNTERRISMEHEIKGVGGRGGSL